MDLYTGGVEARKHTQFSTKETIMKFTMTAAVAAALILIATQDANSQQSDDEVTVIHSGMCLREFKSSPAAQTCFDQVAEVAENNRCWLRVRCPINDDPSDWKISTMIVPYEDIKTLRNCGGDLKAGLC